MLKVVGFSPHPPIIIPDIGGESLDRARNTVDGLRELCRRIKATGPKRLIVITPHGPMLRDGIAVPAVSRLTGDFGDFGAAQIALSFSQDLALLERLQHETEGEQARPVPVNNYRTLDHGAAVPLYYLLQEGLDLPGLLLTFGLLSYRALYDFGKALRRAVESHGLPAAVVASGDLSHRLTPGAPAGYNPRGAEFDHLLIELLRDGRTAELLTLDRQLVEEAGQCGLCSLIIALGMLDGSRFEPEIISYEGPFGVGYLVASITPLADARTEHGKEADPAETAGGAKDAGVVASPPVRLARQALEHYLDQGRPMKAPEMLSPELRGRAAAFVSLKKRGVLRGCIGTIEPVRPTLAEEIIANAVNAAVNDPRFEPLNRAEFDELSISVDVLSPMERISGIEELDPKKFGVLLRCGHRSGLLLPDLEGIESAAEQVDIARRKAGIAPAAPVELYRFTVTRYY
ncbi:MAG: AmmeMemoRadiSam system protein A [Bacillota bacterium]